MPLPWLPASTPESCERLTSAPFPSPFLSFFLNAMTETENTPGAMPWWQFLDAYPLLPEKNEFRFDDAFNASRELETDFFISYRRADGGTTARLLHEMLKSRGLTGFIDVETLGKGDYKEGIAKNIEKARNFIIVISPTIFESPEVIEEVQQAVNMGKIIFPVFQGGMSGFPAIPPALEGFHKHNAFHLHHDKFEFDKLYSQLVSRHALVMSHYRKHWLDQGEAGVSTVVKAWKKMASPHRVIQVATDMIRKEWQDKRSRPNSITVLSSLPTSVLKAIAGDRAVGLDYRGNRRTVLNRLCNWVEKPEHNVDDASREPEYSSQERYVQVKHWLFKYMDAHGRRKMARSDIIYFLNGSEDNGLGLGELIDMLFDSPRVSKVSDAFGCFSNLILNASGFKELKNHFRINCGNSMASIKSSLDDWVDYLQPQTSQDD